MSIRINPAAKFSLLIITYIFLVSIAIDHAFERKTLGLSWHISSEGIAYLPLSNKPTNTPGEIQAESTIKALLINNEPVYLSAKLETDINRIFFSRQSLENWKTINNALEKAFLENAKIQLLTIDDNVIETNYSSGIEPTTEFILLIFCSSVVFIICAYLFSFAPQSQTIHLLMFSATCFSTITIVGVVTPIGEIAPLSLDFLYYFLIIRNWCFLSFIGIIAVYPKRLISLKFLVLWSLVQPLLLLIDLYTHLPAMLSSKINMIVYGLVFFPLFYLQWKRSRSDKTDQTAMKIILYTYIVPIAIFMSLFLISNFFIHVPYFQQTSVSIAYFIVCVSILWMTYRNKILDIEQYWFKSWVWALNGLLLMLGVLFIANTLSLTYFNSFFVALTLFAGFLLLVQKYLGENLKQKNIEHLFPEIMKIIDESGEAEEKWRKILNISFSPLQISDSPQAVEQSQLFKGGHAILLTSPITNSNAYCISGKHQGESLFSNQDIEFINTISNVFKSKSIHANKTNPVEQLPIPESISSSDFETELNQIIDRNIYNEHLSPNFLADEMALSIRALQLKTKKELNASPREIITKRKMEKAAKLLTERTDHINQIAFQLCYENPAYFTRQFKAHYGMTPREHRQIKTDFISSDRPEGET